MDCFPIVGLRLTRVTSVTNVLSHIPDARCPKITVSIPYQMSTPFQKCRRREKKRACKRSFWIEILFRANSILECVNMSVYDMGLN